MPERYLLALLLTLAVEVTVAWLIGLRTGRSVLAVAMVNVITHPLLGYLLLVLRAAGAELTAGLLILLEVLVTVAEWRLLVFALAGPSRRFLLVSLLGNSASFLVGLGLLGW